MAHIAALTAGWQRRLGGQAGPLGPTSAGSGESPNGSRLQVELLVGGTWVDITAYVMQRDGSGGISISRGQPNEASGADPSTCRLQLNNRDGRFSPRNPSSPYFGLIGRNTPLRVSVPSGNDKSYRFQGEVVQWPQRWDTTGADVWVELEAAGILRRLGQGTARVGSVMFLSQTSGAAGRQPVAYWPAEDSAGSTSVASAIAGIAPMTVLGTATFGAFTSFVCSDGLPTMGTASFTGLVPSYTPTALTSVEFLLAVPSGGVADGEVLVRIQTTGAVPTWEVAFEAAGGFAVLRGLDQFGAVVYSPAGGVLVQGVPLQITVELVVYGGSVGTFDASIYGQEVGSPSRAGDSVTVASSSVGRVTSVVVGPGRGLADTAVGHIRVLTDSDFYDMYSVLRAYPGEHAGSRIERLCGAASIAFEAGGVLTTASRMGAQAPGQVLSLLGDCAAVDGGILSERTSALGLRYLPRVALENQSVALTLSYAAFQLAEVPTPVDDDAYTRNDVTVSRSSGSSVRVVETTGPMSVAAPPAGVGVYDETVTLNVEADADLRDQAGWRVHLGTVDEPRYPVIAVNLAHPSVTAALRAQILAVREGDRIAVTGLPSWLPPGDLSQLVRGISDTITGFEHRISFSCSPESPWRVALLGDSTLCRLDTGGSQVAVEASAGATSLSVATTSVPVWTTSDVPFDAVVGGERVTVTAISGATSPQTFTVTRAVNGVSRVLPVGTDVRLYQPAILAL